MSKIRDLMELNYWLGNRSRKNYDTVMQSKRYHPQDKKSVQQELRRLKGNLSTAIHLPDIPSADLP
jgi:hypothetical protein